MKKPLRWPTRLLAERVLDAWVLTGGQRRTTPARLGVPRIAERYFAAGTVVCAVASAWR
jgi:hypothetical protein